MIAPQGNGPRGFWENAVDVFVPRRPPAGSRIARTIAVDDPVTGHARSLQRDALGFLRRLQAEGGDVARFRFGTVVGHLLSHPDQVKHVLVDHHERYNKQTRGFEKLRLVMGNGLVTSEGSFWLRQRRIAQPAFHKKRLEQFATVMVRAAEELAVEWERAAERDLEIDIATDMMQLTLRIVAETLLGKGLSIDPNVVDGALSHLVDDANQRIASLFDMPLNVPTPRNLAFRRSVDTLDRIVYDVIEARRREGPSDDLVSMLLEAVDEETGERMTDAQLRDEVMTFFLAGHETTAVALSWTFYLLGRSPEHTRTLHDELDEILDGRAPTFADTSKLVFTSMTINEAMRLYPPAWIISRCAEQDDVIDGYFIPKGTFVFVSPWVTHRHPHLWEMPDAYDPRRFAPAREESRPRFAFFPFGGGPRLCIGRGFALAEAQLVLATLAQRFRIELLAPRDVAPDPLITLRPKPGVRAKVRRR